MKHITKYHKKASLAFIVTAISASLIFVFSAVFFDFSKDYGRGHIEVYVNGEFVGNVSEKSDAELAYKMAYSKLVNEYNSIVFTKDQITLEEKPEEWAETLTTDDLSEIILSSIKNNMDGSLSKGYMISSGDYSVVVDSMESVAAFLGDVGSEYTDGDDFNVGLDSLSDGSLTGVTYAVSNTADEESSNYTSLGFSDSLDIRPVYTESENIISTNDALSSYENGSSIDVITTSTYNCDEMYDAEIEYVDDDSSYRGINTTIQEGVQGYRNATYTIYYLNGEETDRLLTDSVVYQEAVPEIIAQGTIEPPAFVQPCEGGINSYFGYRWGTLHRGIDYGATYGSDVWASAAGTVTQIAYEYGWGNYVLIDHGNGIETRYAHLSGFNCYVGQYVEQFQVIGFCGSTGNSTGPHVHFEIQINGSVVDPLAYIE